MITALWARVQGWALMLTAALLVLVGAYGAGGRAANRRTELDLRKRNDAARRQADTVDREIDTMDDSAVRQRAGRWVRRNARR